MTADCPARTCHGGSQKTSMPSLMQSTQGCPNAWDGGLAPRYSLERNIPNKISVLRQPPESARYTPISFTEHPGIEGICSSIGTVADAYDNAVMETVMGLLNTESIRTTVFHDGPYRNLADVEWATAGWVCW